MNKCAKSKIETEKAKNAVPGGIQHNLANNHPFALAIEKADGPYLYDIDGNRYIDFSVREVRQFSETIGLQ